MNIWNTFAAKHPAAAKWVREGGLFVIVSNLITVFKYLLLQFLPKVFAGLPMVDFGWPGIDITLFGETFKWNILGYDAAHGGLPYFCAYMVAMVLGEVINFPSSAALCSAARATWQSRSAGMCWRSASSPASSTPSTVSGWRWPGCLSRTSSTTSAPRCSTAASRW